MGKYFLILTKKMGKEKHELIIDKNDHYIEVNYVIYDGEKEKCSNSFSLAGVTSGSINERDIKSIVNNVTKMFKGDVIDEFVVRLNEYKSIKYIDKELVKNPVKKKNKNEKM